MRIADIALLLAASANLILALLGMNAWRLAKVNQRLVGQGFSLAGIKLTMAHSIYLHVLVAFLLIAYRVEILHSMLGRALTAGLAIYFVLVAAKYAYSPDLRQHPMHGSMALTSLSAIALLAATVIDR